MTSSASRERARRPSFRVLLCCVVLVLCATIVANRIEVSWYPPRDVARGSITAQWEHASALAIDREVTSRLEGALRHVPSIERLVASSSPGEARILVEFHEGRRGDLGSATVLDHLAIARRELPPGVEVSFLEMPGDDAQEAEPSWVLQLSGPLSLEALNQEAAGRLVPALSRIPGIVDVRIGGAPALEVLTTLRPRGVEGGSPGVAERLDRFLRGREYGVLRAGARNALLYRAPGSDVSEFDRLPLGSSGDGSALLREADGSRTGIARAPLREISRIDGSPVLAIALHKARQGDLLSMARELREAVERLRHELPAGVDLSIAYDQSEHVHRQLNDLVLRGGIGTLLVVVVLMALLRSVAAVAVALAAVLVSLSCAIMIFESLGLTLSLLTIAGLVLLFGILLDNSVVVVESVQDRSKRSGGAIPESDESIRRAVASVWLPLFGGTLSTCAVFVPMVYLSGELRGLFASFAIVAALTLCASLMVSASMIPAFAGAIGSRKRSRASLRSLRWLLGPFALAARHPKATLLLFVWLVGLPTPLIADLVERPPEGWMSEEEERFAARYNRTIGSHSVRQVRGWLDPLVGGVTRPFLRNVELGARWDFERRPEIRVALELPPGSGVERTEERIRVFEEEAMRSPAVEHSLVSVRGRTATLQILIRDGAMETHEPYLLRERLIASALGVAGVEISITGLVPMSFHSGIGEVSGFTIYGYGPNHARLEEMCTAFARRVSVDPRVAEVDVNASRGGRPKPREVLRLHWGPEATARTGLTARELADRLRPRLWRETPDFFADLESVPRMPVRIVTEGAEDLDLAALLDTPLVAGSGGSVRLADHAEVSIEREPPVIERVDQQYRRALRVHYRGPHRMGLEMLDREIAWTRLPAGYRLERPRYEFFSTEVQRELLWLILGTLALIFLVVAAVLESWRLSAVVMLSVPLAWIGVALGFLLTGQSFAEGAFLGIVLTLGIAVNDSILFADGYRRLRIARRGAPASRLALLALRRRLRPMWTTTLTSIAGMLPLLVLPNAGDFWVGLAVTVVGGLLASTLLAPAATVGLLSWTDRAVPSAPPVADDRLPVPGGLSPA